MHICGFRKGNQGKGKREGGGGCYFGKGLKRRRGFTPTVKANRSLLEATRSRNSSLVKLLAPTFSKLRCGSCNCISANSSMIGGVICRGGDGTG
jgi:hypothetical protein